MHWELIVLMVVVVVWGAVRLASTLFAWADEIERRQIRDDAAGLSVFDEERP
jgi:Sec-independent protein translocase protein TatA